MNTMVFYFFATLIATVVLIATVLKLHAGISEMESKITGIWSNWDDSMRVLIYNINSQIQGEVVWTENSNDKILGATIICDMHLTFFGWSTGVYIDPVTRAKFPLKLKLRNHGKIYIRLMECNDEKNCNQLWRQVQ